MAIEQSVIDRIAGLIVEGESLRVGTEYGQVRDDAHASNCIGWLAAAQHSLSLVCPSPTEAYRIAAQEFSKPRGYSVNNSVGEFTQLLKRLLVDIDLGLLASVANRARAEAFDDLLDHAVEYQKASRLDGAGILATAVFEDTLRRVARSHGVADKDIKTDVLITDLDKSGVITGIVAKRCRAAAGVRNKALHAQWDEFNLDDVQSVIVLTRELINSHLAR